MSILNSIKEAKLNEVQEKRATTPINELEKMPQFKREVVSLSGAINNGSGVIAEFKRASPSKGIIHGDANASKIATGYKDAGVSGISVLTDNHFFKAKRDDFEDIRNSVDLPVLRKEFIVDEWQIFESKAMGVDCILLIAAMLTKDQIRNFQNLAQETGMEALVEVHSADELKKLSGGENIIGVNNRNLNSFEVTLKTSEKLFAYLDENVTRISESGIHKPEDVAYLMEIGYQGFLIGEQFMKTDDPGKACKKFISNLKRPML